MGNIEIKESIHQTNNRETLLKKKNWKNNKIKLINNNTNNGNKNI